MIENVVSSGSISPDMSVIIPTHSGRGRFVREMLEQLHDQTSRGVIEVLVIDSSSGPEADELRDVCESMDRCRYIRGPKDAAGKRNIGGGEALARLLLFVDSDCLVTSEAIRSHLEFMANASNSIGAAIGPTQMIGHDDVHPWNIVRYSRMYNQCYDWPDRYRRVLWGTTSNLVVRREAFLRTGGFRKMHPAPVGGEDVDFGVRLTECGFAVMTNRDAVVLHRRVHIRGIGPIARSLFHYGAADAALVDFHPHRTRPHMPTRLVGAALFSGVLASGGRRSKTAVIVGALGWASARLGRSGSTMYGAIEKETRASGSSPIEILRLLAARCMDAIFTVGSVVGAVRRHDPALALRRFVYVDISGFETRKGTANSGSVEDFATEPSRKKNIEPVDTTGSAA